MSRRGVYRGIYSVLQNDPNFRLLSSRARHTFLSMRLADYVGIACFWRYDLSIISAQTGYPAPDLEPIFRELERGQWVLREGEFMWIRNGLMHDPSLILGNPNHRKGVIRAIEGLPRMAMLKRFCKYYDLPYPFDTHSKAIPKAINNGPGKGLPIPSPNPNPIPSPNPNPRTVAHATGSNGRPTQEEQDAHDTAKREALAKIRELERKYGGTPDAEAHC